MSTTNAHIRHGFGSVRAYMYGPIDLIEFVTQVFDAKEVERGDTPGGAHVEFQIGDSVLILEAGDVPEQYATRGSVYIYVPDVDAAYRQALQLGATSLDAPTDKPYLDRVAGVKDRFGNIWWIGTHLGER